MQAVLEREQLQARYEEEIMSMRSFAEVSMMDAQMRADIDKKKLVLFSHASESMSHVPVGTCCLLFMALSCTHSTQIEIDSQLHTLFTNRNRLSAAHALHK